MPISLRKLVLLLSFFTLLAGCEDSLVKPDDQPDDEWPDPRQPSLPFSDFSSDDATFQATYVSTRVDSGLIGFITYFQGIAIAEFIDEDGNITSPAQIVVEGHQLQFLEGRYRNDPGRSTGIDFGSRSQWWVEGNTMVPEIEEEIDDFVPEIGDITIEDTLFTDEELNLGIDMESPYTHVGTPDSVNYLIVSNEDSLSAKTADLGPVSFSTEELAGLGEGKAYIRVEAFRYHPRDYSGYEVTYVHKGVFFKLVWLD